MAADTTYINVFDIQTKIMEVNQCMILLVTNKLFLNYQLSEIKDFCNRA